MEFFKDREQAGEKLADAVKKEFRKTDFEKNFYIISLLRGGFPVGKAVSRKLKAPHLILASVKIPHPSNPEYALGALCFDKIYTPRYSDRAELERSLPFAEEKFERYRQIFHLQEDDYRKIKGKTVFVVDDGIATGATTEAAGIFLRQFQPKNLILAVPVAPVDFEPENFDDEMILHKDPDFISVSQFYESFPQINSSQILAEL